MDRKPILIVIAGPNGSGKTTITQQLLQHEWAEGATYINPDQIAKEKFGGWNDINSIRQAAEYCDNLREQLLANRKDIVFESVLSTEKKVDFIRRAKTLGYFIRVFFICTASPTINSARVAQRVINGGHDVPIPKIISRYAKSIKNCKIVAPFVNRLYLYDNSVDGENAKLLLRLDNGKIKKQYTENIPRWAKPILNAVLGLEEQSQNGIDIWDYYYGPNGIYR